MKIVFDINSAPIFKAVKLERFIPLWLVKVLEIIFFLGFIFFLLFYLFFYFNLDEVLLEILKIEINKIIDVLPRGDLGKSLISFSLWGLFFLYRLFFEQKIKKPKILNPENIAEFLDFKAAKVVRKTISKNPFKLHLLLYLIRDKSLRQCFRRLLLKPEELGKEIKEFLSDSGSDGTELTVSTALKIAFENSDDRASIFELLSSLVETEPIFKKILDSRQLKKEDIFEVTSWQKRIERGAERRKIFWSRENLSKLGSFGKGFAGGYTILLDRYSYDLTAFSSFGKETVLHKPEIRELEDVLIKPNENCALLVGEPGSGREEIILNLAGKISGGRSYAGLNYKRVVELDMPALIASSGDLRNFELNLKLIANEIIKIGNIILYIEQIHNFIGMHFGAEKVAQVNIAPILAQYVPHPNFRVIGTTTFEGYHRLLAREKEIVSMLARIEVRPPSVEETTKVLEDDVKTKESQTGLFISYPAVKSMVELSDRYISGVFPKKAVDLLDEMIIYETKYGWKSRGVILKEEVETFVSNKVEIPVGEVGAKEKDTLLNMEKIMHRRLIDQEEAVEDVANALRRARANIQTKERTIGNFLFLGPTGVGKTETAKCLAAAYFGSKRRMIRVDMSEYQTIDSINRLLGTETEPGFFAAKVRDDPFSLVLIDEIEKAHPNILNLFLQVFDEGHLTDAMGREVDFRNTIIICTSNAGADLIRQAIQEKKDLKGYKKDFINEILRRGIFRPELLNRYDSVVLYRPLSKENVAKIAEIMLGDIKKGLLEKNIYFEVSKELVNKISELGFNPEFGAREMRRVIQDSVENSIAKAILGGKIKEGNKMEINSETFDVILKN